MYLFVLFKRCDGRDMPVSSKIVTGLRPCDVPVAVKLLLSQAFYNASGSFAHVFLFTDGHFDFLTVIKLED